MKKYEFLVIGWGKAGKTLAAKLSAQGKKVAIVERDKNMYGGTCINVGCLPTKSLVHSAKIVSDLSKYDIERDYEFNNKFFNKAISKKEFLVNKLRTKNYDILDKAENVDIYIGNASFISKNEVLVENEEEKIELFADRIIVNTGATTRLLEVKGYDNSNVITSNEALKLQELPKNLLVVGAGYIGLEFASYFTNFGSNVKVFQFDNSFLPREDFDDARIIKEVLEKKGIEFSFNTTINEFIENENGVEVAYSVNGNEQKAVFDKVLIAIGRKPNIDGLNLENAGIKIGKFGEIVVDEYLRTNVENIWAAGDVKGGPQFTYISLDDSRIILPQLLGKESTRSLKDRTLIPNTTFIDPAYSRVGLNEKEANNLGIKYVKKFAPTMSIPKAHVVEELDGFTKILINEEDEIIGAVVFNYESHEVINLLALAISQKIKYQVLKDFIYTHPVITESLNDLL